MLTLIRYSTFFCHLKQKLLWLIYNYNLFRFRYICSSSDSFIKTLYCLLQWQQKKEVKCNLLLWKRNVIFSFSSLLINCFPFHFKSPFPLICKWGWNVSGGFTIPSKLTAHFFFPALSFSHSRDIFLTHTVKEMHLKINTHC